MEALLDPRFRHVDAIGTTIDGAIPYVEANRRMADAFPDIAIAIDTMTFDRGRVLVRGRLVSETAGIDEQTAWQAEFTGERVAEIRALRPGNSMPLSRMLAD